MQFKSSSQKKLAFALDAEGSIATKLASFQKFTDEMVARFGASNSTEPSQEVLDAVATVLTFIDQMYDTLKGAHDDDVLLAKGCGESVERCESDYMSEQIKNEIQNYQTAAEDALSAHDTCREELAQTCTAYCGPNGDCAEYDGYRKGPPVPSLPDCVGLGHLNDSYIKADEETDGTKLDDMELCLEAMKGWLDPLYELYSGCNRVTDGCTDGVSNCDGLQHTFQSKRCLYALESNLRCENYYNCYENAIQKCDSDCSNIEIRSDARAADNETGQRLVCLLETLFGKRDPSNSTGTGFFPRSSDAERPGELDACKNATIIVGDWSITCPDGGEPLPEEPPQPSVCPPKGTTVTSPCTDEFKNEMESPPSSWVFNSTFNPALTRCNEDLQRGMHQGVDACEEQHACITTHADHDYYKQE